MSHRIARIASLIYRHTFITGALPIATVSSPIPCTPSSQSSPMQTYQKCTVLIPMGLFHRRWKPLCCCSADAAPASVLWKRKPGRRKGPAALRNAAREVWKKRRPMWDVDIVGCSLLVVGVVVVLKVGVVRSRCGEKSLSTLALSGG